MEYLEFVGLRVGPTAFDFYFYYLLFISLIVF